MTILAFTIVVLAILALALFDGGREDLRQITQSVEMPEQAVGSGS